MGLKIGLPGILAQSAAAEVRCLKKCIEKKIPVNCAGISDLSALHRLGGGVSLHPSWQVSTFPSAVA
jgi:hypothetical protein